MHIVHVVTRPGDRRAWETAVVQAAAHRVTVVLLQDAVLDPPARGSALDAPAPGPGGIAVLAGARDLEAYGLAGRHEAVTDEELVALLFAADRVMSW